MKNPGILSRVGRHLRLSRRAARPTDGGETPPFFVLFVNSVCNLACEHCFYWRNLNQRDDLSFEELAALSAELGPIENLNLSGGEPFIRKDVAEIVRLFVEGNGVRQIYVPTSGYFTARTEAALRRVLELPDLQLFACEISLDGTREYHNRFRGDPKSFDNAMATYDMLAGLQAEDERLRIHSVSTVTDQNLEEVRELTHFLHHRCPAMDHHGIGVIRGDRKNPALATPPLDAYRGLVDEVQALWHDREKGRFGAIVEPMLQWAKVRTLTERDQVVPCQAGKMTGVVYANGDVSLCEAHEPLGNLRRRSFREIWASPEAMALRQSVACKECWCTEEIALWPSIVFQPRQLVRAAVGGRVWRRRGSSERAPASS